LTCFRLDISPLFNC